MSFKSQRGTSLLFTAAIILPLFFFLYTLSTDLSIYLTRREASQRILDDVALYSQRYFPYRDQVRSSAVAQIQKRLPHARQAEITYDTNKTSLRAGSDFAVDIETSDVGDTVLIKYREIVPLVFAKILGIQTGLPVKTQVRARVLPFDILIATDRSAYTTPGLYANAWGDPGSWPSADLFRNSLRFLDPHYPPEDPHYLDPRNITQQCFNPQLLAIKRAALRIYDQLASFALNRVALGAYPGGHKSLTLQRQLTPGLFKFDGVHPEADFIEKRLVSFDDTHTWIPDDLSQSEVFVKDAQCFAAAEREAGHIEYALPNALAHLPDSGDGSARPEYLIDSDTYAVDPQAQPFVRAREVIWSRSAHLNENALFSGVLADIHEAVLLPAVHEARGGLKNRSPRLAFVVSSDLPHEETRRFSDGNYVPDRLAARFELMRQDLLLLNSAPVGGAGFVKNPALFSIFYVLVSGVGSGISDCLSSEVQSFESFLQSQSLSDEEGTRLLDLRLLCVDQNSDALDRIVSSIVLEKRSAILAH